MKYCTNCGKALPDDCTFCTECGAKQAAPDDLTKVLNDDTEKARAASGAPAPSKSDIDAQKAASMREPEPERPAETPTKRYCVGCGKELSEGSAFCTECGTRQPVENQPETGYAEAPPVAAAQTVAKPRYSSGVITAIKVLMILGCVAEGIAGFLIPLAWCIPLTVMVCNALNENRPVSVAVKVCSLLFVNTIAGILLLCSENNN